MGIGRKRDLKREIKQYQKTEKEIKGQAKMEVRKKVRKTPQERIKKEEIIRLKDQRRRVVVGKVLKKLKRNRAGKGRKRNQRKERGVKRKNLGRVRGSKVNGNPKHVKLTKRKYKEEKRNKT